ncbi:MAG TPA: tRNA preQ1(34) S-adenosylmethionine ribosyltransferase-isomerase QueA [Sphaerochaeta sp.]|nr:tRNA preQ1(34) S-adenosylmethionine ribosyltransferase-isomerase QueA [Sphaerochaeta sp.]
MTIKEYSFDLPERLIAQHPADRRGEDRLLVLDRATGRLIDSTFDTIASYLDEGSLLVINNTKVRKARVYGSSESGGRVEFLFLEEQLAGSWLVMASKAKKQREGKRFIFSNTAGGFPYSATITASYADGTKALTFDEPIDEAFFTTVGHVPLPPYIRREDAPIDAKRYQTIYAEKQGSVASPTAGLHFTEATLKSLAARSIEIAPITLHVGPGTFLPVRTVHLADHVMHYERYEIPRVSAEAITKAKRNGRPIVAVGTTSVRTLESAWDAHEQQLIAGEGRTNLFIRPPYTFQVVDRLLTNFHTPESTLVVLVSAFASREQIEVAYTHAIREQYRFFSYGDAMLIR